MLEHQRNTLRRSRSVHPVGYAEVGIEIALCGIPEHVVEVALAPGSESQCLAIVPCQRVGSSLCERLVCAILVFVIISLPACFRHPVSTEADASSHIIMLEVVGAIDLRTLPLAVATHVVTEDAHTVVLVERTVIVGCIACGTSLELVSHRHVEVDRTTNQCLLLGSHLWHEKLIVGTCSQEHSQQHIYYINMFLHSLLVFWQGWDVVRHYICAICAILAVIYIARYHSTFLEELCTLDGKVHDLGTPT